MKEGRAARRIEQEGEEGQEQDETEENVTGEEQEQ